MLARALRLTKEPEYRAVYDRGQSRRGESVVVIALECPGEVTRAGVVASRRVGNAVQRNRAKRRLREALRLVWADLPKSGWNLVLVATAGTVRLDYARVVADLRTHLVDLGILAAVDESE